MTMPAPATPDDAIRNYAFGVGGVNLVKDPLLLADNELTQGQNAEFVSNEATGGIGALVKRGGLAALNGSALAGTILGLLGLPLKTTFTRTLYAARQTATANTWTRSTNGTSWTDTASPTQAAIETKYGDNDNARCRRAAVAFRNFIVYPSNAYTQNTDNPPIALWDGTEAFSVTAIPIGPSSNGSPPFVITDMLTANGTVYIAVSDPGGAAPDFPGRVLAIDLATGTMRQVATGFGSGAGEMAGGFPACLEFYMNQLWVGLNTGNTTNGIGKIVRCFPGIDTTWTSDVANLVQGVTSLRAFKGDLYATTRSSVSAAAVITKRSVTAGTWATQATSSGGAAGTGHYGHLIVYSGSLYAAEYHSTTPIIHIVSSSDGASWSTSRDVDSVDGAVAGNLPGGAVLYGSDLYYVFRSTAVGASDGMILRRSGGSWSKVLTDNLLGPIVVLTENT